MVLNLPEKFKAGIWVPFRRWTSSRRITTHDTVYCNIQVDLKPIHTADELSHGRHLFVHRLMIEPNIYLQIYFNACRRYLPFVWKTEPHAIRNCISYAIRVVCMKFKSKENENLGGGPEVDFWHNVNYFYFAFAVAYHWIKQKLILLEM